MEVDLVKIHIYVYYYGDGIINTFVVDIEDDHYITGHVHIARADDEIIFLHIW